MKSKSAELGQKFYDEKLKQILEPEHDGEFVAIEPESGEYFLNREAGEAISEGNQFFPHKKLFLIRIGFDAAFKIGGFYVNRKFSGKLLLNKDQGG
jgi:hypothetical protein